MLFTKTTSRIDRRYEPDADVVDWLRRARTLRIAVGEAEVAGVMLPITAATPLLVSPTVLAALKQWPGPQVVEVLGEHGVLVADIRIDDDGYVVPDPVYVSDVDDDPSLAVGVQRQVAEEIARRTSVASLLPDPDDRAAVQAETARVVAFELERGATDMSLVGEAVASAVEALMTARIAATNDIETVRARRKRDLVTEADAITYAAYPVETRTELLALMTEALALGYRQRLAYISQAVGWIRLVEQSIAPTIQSVDEAQTVADVLAVRLPPPPPDPLITKVAANGITS